MKEYRTKDIVVYWEPDRCSHSAVCLNQLPQVSIYNKSLGSNAAASPKILYALSITVLLVL